MDHKTFNHIVRKTLGLAEETLAMKSKEYATIEDRLHNFSVGAQSLQNVGIMTYDNELLSMFALMLKHRVSCDDIIKQILCADESELPPDIPSRLLIEKFGDQINYLLIMFAHIMDTYATNVNPSWKPLENTFAVPTGDIFKVED